MKLTKEMLVYLLTIMIPPLTPATQILAVLSGLAIMAGAAVWHQKDKDEGTGFYAFVIAMIGVAFVAYGIGGPQLIDQIFNH